MFWVKVSTHNFSSYLENFFFSVWQLRHKSVCVCVCMLGRYLELSSIIFACNLSVCMSAGNYFASLLLNDTIKAFILSVFICLLLDIMSRVQAAPSLLPLVDCTRGLLMQGSVGKLTERWRYCQWLLLTYTMDNTWDKTTSHWLNYGYCCMDHLLLLLQQYD